MKTLRSKSLWLVFACTLATGCYVQAEPAAAPVEGDVVYSDPPPPPPPVVEVQPAPPAVGVVWVGGFHRWDGRRYLWVGGHYERPPHHNAHYVPGHWQVRGRGKIWVNGHWG